MTYDLGIIKRQKYIPTGNTATVIGAITTSFTQDGINYTAHIFTSTGTLQLSTGVVADYLVVGGGGAGGGAGTDSTGGGGGAGAVNTGTLGIVPNLTYSIVVGQGGVGRPDDMGTAGDISYISGGEGIYIAALGGGIGGSNKKGPTSGGNGGGGHAVSVSTSATNVESYTTGAGAITPLGSGPSSLPIQYPPSAFNTNPTTFGYLVFNGTNKLMGTIPSGLVSTLFTVEMWIFQTSTPSGQATLFDTRYPNSNNGINWDITEGGNLGAGNSTQGFGNGSTVISNYRWTHIVLSSTASNLVSQFINGVFDYTYSASSFSNTTFSVGGGANGFFIGYISNFRITQGIPGLYRTSFTTPPIPLLASSATTLLLNVNSTGTYINDSSPYQTVIANTSSVRVTATFTATVVVGNFSTAFVGGGNTSTVRYGAGGGAGSGESGGSATTSTSGNGGTGTFITILSTTVAISLGIGQYITATNAVYFGGGGAGGNNIGVGGGIMDISPYANTLTSIGGATYNAIDPYTSYIGSISVNGTSQYISVNTSTANHLVLGNGIFTIECWIYCTGGSGNRVFIDTRNPDSNGFDLTLNSSNKITWGTNGSTYIGGGAITISNNVWYHIALSKTSVSAAATLYINGTADGSGGPGYNGGSANTNYRIGWGVNGFFPGYITDVRIVKGFAVYTGNFTAPTAPLQVTQVANPYGGSNVQAIFTSTYTSLLITGINSISPGQGGYGGGGTGGLTSTNAIQYTGGGGGGVYASGSQTGGNGGSGVVIIRYPSFSTSSVFSSNSAVALKEQPDPKFKNNVLLLSKLTPITYAVNDTTTAVATSNTNFIDSSYNYNSITASGTPRQGSFSPFGENWSVYFNGSSDYIITSSTFNTSVIVGLAGSKWTIEAWVYLITNSNTPYNIIGNYVGSGVNGRWYLAINSSNKLQWDNTTGTGSEVTKIHTTALSVNTWTHVAVTIDATTSATSVVDLFVNGVSTGSTIINMTSQATSYQAPLIGSMQAGGVFSGYMSNFRMVKGTTVYTSNFAPPAGPLPSITNTILLTCASNRLLDKSPYGNTFTVNNAPTVYNFSPFAPVGNYSALYTGGSVYFNGNGVTTDYLTATSSNTFAFGTGAWTVEAWVYVTTLQEILVFDTRTAASTTGIGCRISATGLLTYSGSSNNSLTGPGSTNAISTNVWVHVAWVYTGVVLTGYINGQVSGSATVSFNLSTTSATIGKVGYSSAGYMPGYISNLRVVKGTALYTANFAPPSTTLKPINTSTSTSLLLNFTNSAIVDGTQTADIRTSGSASLSSAVNKYTSYSMYFNGSTDLLTSSYSALYELKAAQPFTVEMWVYPTVFTGYTYRPLISKGWQATGTLNWELYVGNTGTLYHRYWNGSSVITSTSNSLTLNTWNHVAWVWDGGNTNSINLYINGVSGSTTTISGTPESTTVPLQIGFSWDCGGSGNSYFSGYLDDIRIGRIARYTGNFTPPQYSLPLR